MRVLEKCPVCSDFATAEKRKSNEYQRAFRCEKGHLFRKMREESTRKPVEGVLSVMPDWTKILNDCRRPLN